MPLSPRKSRNPLHTRLIELRGNEREDGLWDIEGRLVDTRTYDFDNPVHGSIRANQPLHGLWIRLRVNLDFLIHDAEAAIDNAPFSACRLSQHPMFVTVTRAS